MIHGMESRQEALPKGGGNVTIITLACIHAHLISLYLDTCFVIPHVNRTNYSCYARLDM